MTGYYLTYIKTVFAQNKTTFLQIFQCFVLRLEVDIICSLIAYDPTFWIVFRTITQKLYSQIITRFDIKNRKILFKK